jgi:regulator of sigma E protease
MAILSFIIVLGVLIFFHELGHFLVAKSFGVGIEKFSLGFGPRLFGKTIGRTDYRLSAIPLGGYVKMVGEEPDKELDPEDIPFSFTHKHVFKRLLIVAAGPFFNFFLAVLIFFSFYQIYGTAVLKPVIGEVMQESPAEKAGIKTGDEIVYINAEKVDSWEKMAVLISESKGAKLYISLLRKDRVHDFEIKPMLKSDKNIFGEDIERYVIGITHDQASFYNKRLNPIQALCQGITQTYNVTKLTIIGIVKLIQGKVSKDTLGGPIMIAQMSGEQAKQGVSNLIIFIAFLSINLAVINFLPIPVLDGGHILFFMIELIIGRPVNTKIRQKAQQFGISILILLMIYAFYNDIVRIFAG